MPWHGPEYEGDFPSLGWGLLDWVREYLIVPDGPFAGEPLTLTDEQVEIVVAFYALDDRGRWIYRRGAVRRAQGWGKSPVLAAVAAGELCGPTRFGGWSADGEPVGIAPSTPLVQMAAVSEDQTANTYSALYDMLQESELNGTVLDVGQTRVHLKEGVGRLEPVTSAAGTRLGQRLTFVVMDETHLWDKRNGGIKLAATLRRNAGKMNGRTFESTNAHIPGADTVAERTYQASVQGAPGLYYNAVEAPPVEDMRDKDEVIAALRVAYGDSYWVPIERLADEIADPATDPDDARRFYFNHLVAGTDKPVDITHWRTLVGKDADGNEREPQDGEYIGLGFDGSISNDQTSLYGCTADGFIFDIKTWMRPEGAARNFLIPRHEVHDKLAEVFERYKVGRMLCDPARWYSEIEQWGELYDEKDKDPRVIVFDTNSSRRFAPACDRFSADTRESSITHDGGKGLELDLAACLKKKVRINDDEDDGRTHYVWVKADTRKIDRAIAACLAREAAATMPAYVNERPPGIW